MTLEGFDYTSVSPATAKADGAKFVVRYLSAHSKGLTASERDELHRLGVGIGVVYETTGVTFMGGEKAGSTDGSAAKSLASGLGVPTDAPIWFAIDTDTSNYTEVKAYLKGCQEGCAPYTAKLYAGARVLDAVGGTGHWQTYAWSGGEISRHADLYQYLNGTTLDHDRTLNSNLEVKNGWLTTTAVPPVTATSTTPTTSVAVSTGTPTTSEPASPGSGSAPSGSSVAPAAPPAPVAVPTAPVAAPAAVADALTKAEAMVGKGSFHNECLIFVREQFGLSADGREPTAAASWDDCPAAKRHASHDGHSAPRAVPFVFSGGASGAGHIVIMKGDGVGGCISSDWPDDDGKVGHATIDEILAKWSNLHPLGWMEELEGHVVYTAPVAPAPVVVPPAPAPTPVHPPVAGGSANGNWSNFPGSHAFKLGHADPAVWILGLRLEAAGFGKHKSFGKKHYAPSHVFSLHDLENVMAFQQAQGWTGAHADGFPGPLTWQKLGEASGWKVS